MSSTPGTGASGAGPANSYFGHTGYRHCRGKNCRPLDPAPSPEPTFHSHWWNRETGQASGSFWGTEFGDAAMDAAEAFAAPGSSSSGKRRGKKKSGGCREYAGEAAADLSTPAEQEEEDEGQEEPASGAGERTKVGGTAAAAGTVEQEASFEGVTEADEGVMLPLNRPPAHPAQPAEPARGADFLPPVVPVWKLLQAAYGSAGEPGETAARQMRIFKELVASSSPVGRMVSGRSSVHGFGMFATREILTQSVLTEFTGQRIPEALAQKRVAVYRRMGLKGFVVQLGGDPTYVDVKRGGFPGRLVNNSCEPNSYLYTVTAGRGDSEEKRIFLFSLKTIAMGEEIVYSYPAPGSIGLGPAFSDACTCGAPVCCGIMDGAFMS